MPKKAKSEVKKSSSDKKETYYYAVGRRKTATAQAWIKPAKESEKCEVSVNGKPMDEYFATATFQNNLLRPLKASGFGDKVSVRIIISGGGPRGQVEAARLAISRALVKQDESLKKSLRAEGLLTRDSRKVERKKAGLKKARRAPQWQKR